MKKLKYGLLLILSMILFSVPVLAAKTYYLPSKVVTGSDYREYSYDKYGHMIKCHTVEEIDDGVIDDYIITWKYKYDKKGKRISGEEYYNDKLRGKLTFDKNDRLKTIKPVSGSGETVRYLWNAKGYAVGNPTCSMRYKYAYYNNGKIKKMESYYINGELSDVAYFDKSGLRSKNPPVRDDYKVTYEYVLDKNGLVKSKTITTKMNAYRGQYTRKYYYSKTKTDAKTYFLFIDDMRTCESNSNL